MMRARSGQACLSCLADAGLLILIEDLILMMTRSNRATLMAWMVIGVLGLIRVVSAAEQPLLLPFQGHLTTTDGKAMEDGIRTVQFHMFDAPIAGNKVWAGEVHRLSINSGLVNTVLGTRVTIPRQYGLSVPMFSRPLYLEIIVDSDANETIDSADPPLLPRQVIFPSLFASEAGNAQTLKGFDWSEILVGSAEDPSQARIDGRRIAEGSIPLAAFDADVRGAIASLQESARLLERMRTEFNFQVLGSDVPLDDLGGVSFSYQSRGGRIVVMVSLSARATTNSEGPNFGLLYAIRIKDQSEVILAETQTRHWWPANDRIPQHTFPTAFLEISGDQDPADLRVEVVRVTGPVNLGDTQRVNAMVIEFPDFSSQ